MTKKDYIIIARGLNAMVWNYQGEAIPQKVIMDIVQVLSNGFIHDNPRFDEKRFKEAVYKK